MAPQSRFPHDLHGNFTAYIPRQLTVLDLRLAGAPPEAVGFPNKITYAGNRPGLVTPELRFFVAEYRPSFESFIHAGSCRKLSYAWSSGGRFHIDVLHNAQISEWNIYKFSDGQLISHACAQGYGEAMIHASGIGLHDDEPAYTFAGPPEECRRENLAQSERANSRAGEEGDLSHSSVPGAQVLVFGVVESLPSASNLVFIPLEKAEELAAIHGALKARTWGEFKLKMPASRLPELLNTFSESGAWTGFDDFYRAHAQNGTRAEREALWQHYEKLAVGERMPLDQDAFSIGAVPGPGQGQWPERPEYAMLRWLPSLIHRRFGRRSPCPRYGDRLVFDLGHAPEILAALEAAGYCCLWDEELVRRSCGAAGS
jgi:hypothetical protein